MDTKLNNTGISRTLKLDFHLMQLAKCQPTTKRLYYYGDNNLSVMLVDLCIMWFHLNTCNLFIGNSVVGLKYSSLRHNILKLKFDHSIMSIVSTVEVVLYMDERHVLKFVKKI